MKEGTLSITKLIAALELNPEDTGGPSRLDMLRQRALAAQALREQQRRIRKLLAEVRSLEAHLRGKS